MHHNVSAEWIWNLPRTTDSSSYRIQVATLARANVFLWKVLVLQVWVPSVLHCSCHTNEPGITRTADSGENRNSTWPLQESLISDDLGPFPLRSFNGSVLVVSQVRSSCLGRPSQSP